MLPHRPQPPGVPDMIRCAVNPSAIDISRDAGLVARPAEITDGIAPGEVGDERRLPGRALAFGAMGRTTLSLNLLFESPETAPGRRPIDVRQLTLPLYRLAAPVPGQGARPCPVDLIWGKNWSFTGAVGRLAERLDRFSSAGIATRSWLSIEFEARAGRPFDARGPMVHWPGARR